MPKSHPHEEATYRVIAFDGANFAVEVSIPGSHPTKVSPFATKQAAEDWIIAHKERVESQSQSGRWFQGSRSARR
jgi:hypothetical protein